MLCQCFASIFASVLLVIWWYFGSVLPGFCWAFDGISQVVYCIMLAFCLCFACVLLLSLRSPHSNNLLVICCWFTRNWLVANWLHAQITGFWFSNFFWPENPIWSSACPENFFAGPNFQFFLQQLMSTDGRTDGRRRISPGPRPLPIPDRGRACRRILYREVTSSVPPLQQWL